MNTIEWHKVPTNGTWDGRDRYYCVIEGDKIFIEENSKYQFMSGWTVLSDDLLIKSQVLNTHDFGDAKRLAIDKVKEIISNRTERNKILINKINELNYE